MKAKKILLITLLSLNLTMFGQICGTPSIETSKSSQRIITKSEFLKTSNLICINVFYHIVRDNSGNGGFNSSQLDNVTNTLNTAFNEHNLYINTLGLIILIILPIIILMIQETQQTNLTH